MEAYMRHPGTGNLLGSTCMESLYFKHLAATYKTHTHTLTENEIVMKET